MADEFITGGELALLLAVFGGPIHLLATGLGYAVLRWAGRRSVVPRRHIVVALGLAFVTSIPLTLVLWLGSGHLPSFFLSLLPAGHGVVGFATMVGPPAVAASMVCVSLAVYGVLRRSAPTR